MTLTYSARFKRWMGKIIINVLYNICKDVMHGGAHCNGGIEAKHMRVKHLTQPWRFQMYKQNVAK